jgi:two-component SAPR family response regulator
MEPPEIPIFTKPDIYETILEVTISYYKDYPNFFYLLFHRDYLTKAIPIEKLETLIDILNSIKEEKKDKQ